MIGCHFGMVNILITKSDRLAQLNMAIRVKWSLRGLGHLRSVLKTLRIIKTVKCMGAITDNPGSQSGNPVQVYGTLSVSCP